MRPRSLQRRKVLVDARLQLRLVAVFAGMAVFAMILQYMLLAEQMMRLAETLDQEGDVLLDAMPGLHLRVLATTACIVVPLTAALGIMATFRIAGPIYRFERYLESVLRGEARGPCAIRQKDEFQRLCALINSATESARAAQAPAGRDVA